MKKLLALAAAFLSALVLSVCAGAVNLNDYRSEYDDRFECYSYYDSYGNLVADQTLDGEIYWYIDTSETSEITDPYEEETTDTYEEEITDYWDDLAVPEADYTDYGNGLYEVYSTIDKGWKPDGCTLKFRTSEYDAWTEWGDTSVYDDGTQYRASFFPDFITDDDTYYFELSFFKYSSNGDKIYNTYSAHTSITAEEYEVYEEPADDPEVTETTVTDKTAAVTAVIDKNWHADGYTVYRSEEGSDVQTLVGTFTNLKDHENWIGYSCLTFEDSGLKPETTYNYRIEFTKNSTGLSETVCDIQFTVTTDTPLADPEMLEPEAYSDKITITAAIDERWNADGFLVQKYSSRKKKWLDLYESERLGYYSWDGEHEILSASYTDENLKSAVKYKYRIQFFKYKDDDSKEKEYFGKLDKSVYTLLKAPVLDLGATSKKSSLKWNKVSGASGYEVYCFAVDPGSYNYGWFDYGWGYYSEEPDSLSRYNTSYESSTLYSIDISQFKKKATIKSGSKTSASYSRKKDKIYVFKIRAYKKAGKTKIYGEYSNQVTTDSTSALLNGLTLKSKVTVSDYDLGLIKKALKKCVNKKMSSAQKAAAVYDYVHNAAIYEYDFSLIPADPIEAILSAGRGQCYQYAVTYQAMMKYLGFDVKLVSGKTSSGGGHWWCELKCAGTSYMIDPQVGGRFLIRYDQMGPLAVQKEKVYD